MSNTLIEKPRAKAAPTVADFTLNPGEDDLATVEQLAAIEFEPVPEFVLIDGRPKNWQQHEGFMRTLQVTVRMAIALLGKTKAELVAIAEEAGEDAAEELQDRLTQGRKDVEALHDIMRTAELRSLSAMSVVYGKSEAA